MSSALVASLLLSLAAAPPRAACGDPLQHRSATGGAPKSVRFYNASKQSVLFYWNDLDGGRQLKGSLPTGEATSHGSSLGHVFVFAGEGFGCIGAIEVRADVDGYVITDHGIRPVDAKLMAQFEKVRASAYQRVEQGGYVFHVNQNAAEHPKEVEELRALLVKRADEAKALLPAYRAVIDPVEFFVEWDRRDTSQLRYIVAKDDASAENHAKWHHVEVTGVVAATRLLRTEQTLGMLHEYVHAIRDHADPPMRAKITQAYEVAKAITRFPNAYAFKNDDEFVACHAVAWFGTSVDSEISRTSAEMKEQSPKTAALLEELLGPAPPIPEVKLAACVTPLPVSPNPPVPRVCERWINTSQRPLKLEWVSPDGGVQYPTTLAPGAKTRLNSRLGNVTRVSELDGGCVGLHVSPEQPDDIVLQ